MAEENKLSTKEVQRIFLNKVAFDLGFKCNHERIGLAPDKEPFCKDCWTRLRKVIRPTYLLDGKLIKNDFYYAEKETFLDDFYRDRKAREIKEARRKRRAGEEEPEHHQHEPEESVN
jgi:hypothetical protein